MFRTLKNLPHIFPMPYTAITWNGTYRGKQVSIGLKDLTFVAFPTAQEVLFKYRLNCQFRGMPHQGFHDDAERIWINVSLWQQNVLLYNFGRLISEELLNYNRLLSRGSVSSPQEIWYRFENNNTPSKLESAEVKFHFPKQISFFKNTLVLEASEGNPRPSRAKNLVADVCDDDYFNYTQRYYHR